MFLHTDTQAQKDLVEALSTRHNYDIDKLYGTLGMRPADVNATAMEMIKATSRGDAELYYPPVNGISPRVAVAIRSLWPSLLVYDESLFLKD